jgi:hypothetical protein
MVPFLSLGDLRVLALGNWPVLLAATILIARPLLPRSSVIARQAWREIAIVVGAYLAYLVVRGVVAGRQFEAFEHATAVIRAERSLGIFWEIALQRSLTDTELLTYLANWMYVWGHWPVIISVAVWLFFRQRDEYYLYRNAFLISGAIGLVIFSMMPVAPPRFMPAWGFIDTVASYRAGSGAPVLINEYAAMPSLHLGWNLLISLAVVRHAGWLPAKAIGVLLPPAMFMSIVLTGNHYILDGVAGVAVALLALGIAALLRRNFDRRDSDRDGREDHRRPAPVPYSYAEA